jgi:hypothetical protein
MRRLRLATVPGPMGVAMSWESGRPGRGRGAAKQSSCAGGAPLCLKMVAARIGLTEPLNG